MSGKGTRTRSKASKSDSLPPDSRDGSAFDNLARGLPARSNSNRSVSIPKPKASRDTPGSAGPSTHPTSTSDVGKNNQISHESLEAVTQVCESQNAPLQRQIADIRDEVRAFGKLPAADYSAWEEDLARTRTQQNEQFASLAAQLEPLANLNQLACDMASLRRDANRALENQSSSVHLEQPATENAQLAALEAQIAELREKLAAAPSAVTAEASQPSRANAARDNSDSSDSDDEYANTPVDEDSDDDRAGRIPFFSRSKGPRYRGLLVKKPSDPLFDRLTNYRYYRLLRQDRNRDAGAMLDANKKLKALALTLGSSWKFDGSDPILVFQFLTRLTEEADLVGMTEAQLFAALPRFLTGSASTQFHASRSASRSGGVRSWPEAVHYFLGTYATPLAIRQAVQKVSDLKQGANESELEYSARLCEAIHRCGNVYDEPQKMTLFINGLVPEIQSVVARFREQTPRSHMRYEALVQFARDEGHTYRTRAGIGRAATTRKPSTPPPRPRDGVHFIDKPEVIPDTQGADLFLATQEHSEPNTGLTSSINTSDLPDTDELNPPNKEGQEVLVMAPPPRIQHATKSLNSQRPGWVQRQAIICHHCYAPNHVSPDCELDPSALPTVVSNYEALTEQQRKTVPRIAYDIAKKLCAKGGLADPSKN